VELNQYNLLVDMARAGGYPLQNQRRAFGGGLGLSYKLNYLDVGLSLNVLFSPAKSSLSWEDRDGYGDYYYYYYSSYTLQHTLINYILCVPVGLSFPISSGVSFHLGLKPMFGLSRLLWYDSAYYYRRYRDPWYDTTIISWETKDARLGASSFGLGFVVGGDILFSKNLGLYIRFGYDAIKFKNYEGEMELRDSYGTKIKTPAYLVYDFEGGLWVKSRPYNPLEGEIPGEENLSGFRLDVGLKIGLGR